MPKEKKTPARSASGGQRNDRAEERSASSEVDQSRFVSRNGGWIVIAAMLALIALSVLIAKLTG